MSTSEAGTREACAGRLGAGGLARWGSKEGYARGGTGSCVCNAQHCTGKSLRPESTFYLDIYVRGQDLHIPLPKFTHTYIEVYTYPYQNLHT